MFVFNDMFVFTQVVNNFFVKQTRDQKESVAYLTIMTRYLQAYYAVSTLGEGGGIFCLKSALSLERYKSSLERTHHK